MKTTRQNNYKGPQTLQSLIPDVVRPLLKDQGYYLATLMLEWPIIVGETIASQCRPRKLSFAKGEHGKGKLHISATSGFSMELGYYSLILIEKINMHMGFALVDKITTDARLVLKPVTAKPVLSWQPTAQSLDEALTRLQQQIKK